MTLCCHHTVLNSEWIPKEHTYSLSILYIKKIDVDDSYREIKRRMSILMAVESKGEVKIKKFLSTSSHKTVFFFKSFQFSHSSKHNQDSSVFFYRRKWTRDCTTCFSYRFAALSPCKLSNLNHPVPVCVHILCRNLLFALHYGLFLLHF